MAMMKISASFPLPWDRRPCSPLMLLGNDDSSYGIPQTVVLMNRS